MQLSPLHAATVNVLLVDDHPENLVALEAILEGLGQNLVKAHSGEEALRCLLHQDFAVILLDVQMPGMDGFEAATLIRQRQRSRNTPIIFLTAFNTSDELMVKGYGLGAVDYLFKPLNPAVLTSKVTAFIELFQTRFEVEQQAAQLAQINAELKRSEERFRLLSRFSPVGIFLMDTQGHYSYANPSCQEICGFTVQQNWQANWTQVIHPDDRERVLSDWSVCIQQGEPYSSEFRIERPELRWVNVRSSPMLSDGAELLGHVGTIEDITDRQQAEATRTQMIQEQTARQQAETANRMKDEFLAIVSHELRTPLNSILGWSQLLLNRKLDESTTQRALETIDRNARSQAQLIEDILDVSQIIRGKLRLTLQPINILSVIESVIESVRPMAESKSIQIHTEFTPPLGKLYADAERLRQIIWNLLSNAIKFTPEQGNITVRLTQTDCDPSAQIYAQVQVIDSGIGINPDFLPYIFDRFRQADSTTTRPYSGLGLGLAIVDHLVKQHGGSIWAASEGENKGAQFTLNLPLVEVAEPVSDQPPPPNPATNGSPLSQLKVLVVEDNHDTRDFLTMVLEQSGAIVTAVASVSEAICHLEQAPPDLLLSDIGMPVANGYDLIRHLRQREKQQSTHIPAIALTAYARAEDQMQAIEAGFEMHLTKPIGPEELLSAVARAVGR
ncbi:MAG: response regulator [Pegethrix bostrychoides GSE-TBD4-15B]|jgi:hypothetical protein|uniref:Circadian input-output histidine kinase CikA n=1 Tax=Pegethrix bostrychoides GSE-TBD4-15B TaxID=2839662 RepID=A0A951P916_9CYAN|nr:response regulator [Pegethrix bostrychoides GSE-TBD4-15B]